MVSFFQREFANLFLAKLTELQFRKALLKSLTSNAGPNGFYEHMGAILIDQPKFMHRETMNIYEFDLPSMLS